MLYKKIVLIVEIASTTISILEDITDYWAVFLFGECYCVYYLIHDVNPSQLGETQWCISLICGCEKHWLARGAAQ